MDGIHGLWVAVATPVTSGGVDTARLAAHADWLLGEGCDGLVLFGTTGEGTSFSARERLDAVAALLRHGIAAGRLGLGTGFPSVTDTVALTRDMLALGLRHALVLPPYFYRDAPAEGLEDAFAALLDGVADDRLRATLYHIPQVSGVTVPPAVLARLRARYGVVLAGVKDSSGEFAHFRAFRAAAPDVSVTVGSEADIGRAVAEGGAGTICGMANLVPNTVRAMFGGTQAAEDAMRAALALMQGPFVPVLKSALAAMTGDADWARTRAPLRAVEPAVGQRIAHALQTPQETLVA